jgi:hypothetical protein
VLPLQWRRAVSRDDAQGVPRDPRRSSGRPFHHHDRRDHRVLEKFASSSGAPSRAVGCGLQTPSLDIPANHLGGGERLDLLRHRL